MELFAVPSQGYIVSVNHIAHSGPNVMNHFEASISRVVFFRNLFAFHAKISVRTG